MTRNDAHPIDSATRGCCNGIGRHTPNGGVIPLPAGAECADGWEHDEPQAYRVIKSAKRYIDGHEAYVYATAVQFADGGIDVDREPPTVNVEVSWEDGLTSGQAGELALLIAVEAARIKRWAAGRAVADE